MITNKSVFPALAFGIVFLYGAAYTSLLIDLAIYFLSNELIHRISGLLLLIVFLWGSFKLFSLLKKKSSITVYGCMMILIVESFSFQFLFYFRPYTLYFSVILFLNLTFVLVMLGYVASALISDTKIHKLRTFQSLLISIFIILIIEILPINDQFNILPFFLPLPIIIFYTWILLEKQKPALFTFLPSTSYLFVMVAMISVPPIETYDIQSGFEDKVIYATDSDKHQITITQWMDNYWLYLNNLKNFSTIDEFLFYEPLVHTAASIQEKPQTVLILGGENGCAARELLKYKSVQEIILAAYDTVLLNLAISHPTIVEANKSSLTNKKVSLIRDKITLFITSLNRKFDLIIIDLPDPRNIDTNQFYTIEFYEIISNLLKDEGIFITQAGSPYFATKAYKSIEYTIKKAGFYTLPIHNQVLTLGEWGWIIGSKTYTQNQLKLNLLELNYANLNTRWLNKEANVLLTSFGKDYINFDTLQENSINNPVLYGYYLDGTWSLD